MKHVFAFLIFLVSIQSMNAQVATDSALYQIMKKQSSQLYERGFNQCDMAYLESVSHKDLKAYYDQGEAQNRAKFFEDVQKYHCTDAAKKPIRKVDSDSLEVFPLYDNGVLYGAVQSGSLTIYLHESGQSDIQTGTAKFTHVWLLEDGKWLLKEVMAFGYQEIKQP